MSEPTPTSKNTWTGATSADWTDGSNWSTGAVPADDTSADVNGVSAHPPVLGESGHATGAAKTLVVDGAVDDLGGLTLQDNSTLTVERVTVGLGWVTVNGGSRLTTLATGGVFLGGGVQPSQFTVTGTGSALVVESGAIEACVVGHKGPGILTVSDGASLQVVGDLLVGVNVSQGTVFIQGGGNVVGRTIHIGLAGPDTGRGELDWLGTISVTAGCRLVAGERLVVGDAATGALDVLNATVTAPIVDTSTGAKAAVAFLDGAVLETVSITKGRKTRITFDGATIRAMNSSQDGAPLIGSLSGAVKIGARGLTIDAAGHVVDVNAELDGPGNMTKVGAGTVVLHANNAYLAGTTVEDGVLRIRKSVVGDVVVRPGATLAFDLDRQHAFGGIISGGGPVEHAGADLYLLRDNTYTGGTTVTGTLILGKGTTEGSIIGDVVVEQGGGLFFMRSDTYVFTGRVSGKGTVRQVGSGTTVLTGACTHTGGTNVDEGTLQLGDGGATGHLTGNVDVSGASEWLPAAAFVFNRSDTYTFDGIISGGGGVTQAGSGTVILTAASTCTGPTTVEAGTLQVTGASASPVTVGAGATLGGSGTIGADVTSAGVVSPGVDGAGTLTVAGNFVSNGGTLAISASLGGNESPHTLLWITGDAVMGTGPTTVTIANVGGTGAPTAGDGIRIVEIDGASPAGLFVLASPVVVGGYRYDLVQGAVTNPDDRNWYLRTADVGV